MKSAKSVVSVIIGKVLKTTAQEHWKFPPKTFLITTVGMDYTDLGKISHLINSSLSNCKYNIWFIFSSFNFTLFCFLSIY